jgi:hypothetical protein
MRRLIAIHEIHRRDPANRATGRFSTDGSPVLDSEQLVTRPGEAFEESDDREAQWLIDNNAAIPAD